MKKIYIAGKITGECETPELLTKCLEKFNSYGGKFDDGNYIYYRRWLYDFLISGSYNDEGMFSDKCYCYTHGLLINEDFIGKSGQEWKDYMKRDLAVLLTCDEIHMLPDWKDSRGARIEHQLAIDLKIKIVYV